MAIARQCLLVTLFLTATLFTGAIQGAETPDKPSAPITDKPTTSSTTVPPAPTPVPETTTKGPETTTKPSSTTVPPTTESTTTPQPTTSSTAPPTTTPVVPPTPTPAPSKPAVGNWTIAEGNQTCAMFQAAITVDLAFTNKANKTQHYNVYVPADAKIADEKCGVADNSFSLVFPAGHVQMSFVQNNSHYYLQKVESWINATVLPDLANQTSAANFTVVYVAETDSMALEGSLNSSFVCTAPAALKMTNGTLLKLSSVNYQAFIKDGKLGPAQNCVTDSSPDMVPILVAGGLILFVVLMLIAYIVTRQRQARGYHSM
ncbi:hypothetical protein LSTR_LSTR006844 [Laodelphax striatellus]|uniref:Lysosome-associated membrane glycoprotein 5 n=1 Tax=Laodelphax striatellus TaxID=195883 RepID=A0A482XF16_LAOST|nr:hypothetical protein LSTR_LSTR006844 [Laodelphax striatellus]